MKNEKRKSSQSCAIKVAIISGMTVLLLLIIGSVIGIVWTSLCKNYDLLTVFISAFVAAIGSFLTVLALLFTVKHDRKMIELQQQTIEMEKAKNESEAANAMNKIRNSLTLEKIEINGYLQPKDALQINPNFPLRKDNFRIGFTYSANGVNELNGAALKYLSLLFWNTGVAHKNDNAVMLKFNTAEFDFFPITPIDSNHCLYEIITNISDKRYGEILAMLKKQQGCYISAEVAFYIEGNNGATSYFSNKGNPRYFNFSQFVQNKQLYIFKV